MVQLLSELFYKTGLDRRVNFFGKIEHLLANLLCHYAELYGEEHDYGFLIRHSINKQQIAQVLGISRRSVIRAFEIPDAIKLTQKARGIS